MELVLALFGSFFIGTLLLCVALYVVSSLCFVKVFKKLGYQSPGFGWIPIFNIFVLATIVSTGTTKVKVLGAFELDTTIYRYLWLLPIVIGFIPGSFGTLLSIAFTILYYGDIYSRVYASIDNTTVEEQTAIGAISGFISIIFIFKVLASNNDQVQLRYRADDVH